MPRMAELAEAELRSQADISGLRNLLRAVAEALALRPFIATRIATAALELARNAVEHGGGGQARLALQPSDQDISLMIEITDQGAGLVEGSASGLSQRQAGKAGLGLGLAGVRQMADRFEMKTGVAGTQATAWFAVKLPMERWDEIASQATSAVQHFLKEQDHPAQQLRQLTAELAERELMVGEVHHRTANNLALVNALISMELRRAQTDEAKEILRNLDLKIRAIARAHAHLQHAEGDVIEAHSYLRQVGNEALALARHDLKLSLHVDAGDIVLPGQLGLDMGMVTGELMTNAFKHAFVGRSAGRIGITLQEEGGTLVYRFSDDGAGLPPDVAPHRSGSLGWRVIRAIASKHSGHLDVDGKAGLAVELRLPAKAWTTTRA